MHGSASASQEVVCTAPSLEEAIFLRGAPALILKKSDLVSHTLNTAFSLLSQLLP